MSRLRKKTNLLIRPATADDIAAFSDLPAKPSIRAWVAELDGRIVGLAGVALVAGRWLAFCDLTADIRPHKIAIARAAIRFLEQCRRDGIRYVYAEADLREPGSRRWLTSLGFEIDPRTLHLYRWRP
jgi:GNAT superfamily N-acetyltransferase